MAPRPGPGTDTYVTFIYSERYNINPPAAGLAGIQVFNLTSLFDPNVTGVGHQPVNFDQYALMFEKYEVYKAEIKTTLASGSSNLLWGMAVSDFPTTSSDPAVYIENGQAQWKVTSTAGGGNDVQTCSMTVDIAKANGVTRKQLMADDVYRSDFTTSPSESIYAHIFAADVISGDPGAVSLVTEIRFHTRLIGTKLNALS